ncbi:MAG: hypothetical protein AAEJ57_08120 [Opitutales bacterium]
MKVSPALFILPVFVGFLNPFGAFAASPSVIDDAALRDQFQRNLEGLYNTKKATPLKNLTQQLSRPKARMKLPRARALRLPPGEI